MSSRRKVTGYGGRAYRLVVVDTGYREYLGPFGSLSSAQQRRDTLASQYSGGLPSHIQTWIEETPEGWTKVKEV